MQARKGIPVSPGVAIAPAVVLEVADLPVRRQDVSEASVAAEMERLDAALDASREEVQQLHRQVASTLGEDLAKIFTFHVGLMADPQVAGRFRKLIEEERVTSEYAVYEVMRELRQTFSDSDSPFLRERVSDLRDLEKRLLKHLRGEAAIDLQNIRDPSIIVAHDLTPSQTASLDKQMIRGIAIDVGGQTSHTAILAHALGIPAVVGLKDITRKATTGEQCIVDGQRGLVTLEPDEPVLAEYGKEIERLKAFTTELAELRDEPAVTLDGTKVELLANIEFPYEINAAVEQGAEGVGLYRTEFAFLAADRIPTEDEQYELFVHAIKTLKGRPLTIRTLDLGADKMMNGIEGLQSTEPNPFLGVRSIRLCLQNLPLFRTQLRAILRASVEGPVRLMFPLISNINELRQAKIVLEELKEELDDADIPYEKNLPVGMMIEVPSAAIQSDSFAKEVDFFSIGTNDLIQYTVAADRSNERIANLYSAAHPAVITLIAQTVRAADKAEIEVSLCGEIASETQFTMLLLGLGLRKLSITPPAIPEVKRLIRSVEVGTCEALAEHVAGLDSEREVTRFLREQEEKVNPGAGDGRSIPS